MSFFGIGMKSDLFQSCGHCWVFQIWWHIECTLTASSLKFWSSSVASPSLPLTLFIVMLPKAYLTLHSRKSGCRWMITPSWLSGSLKPFLCSSSVYSCLEDPRDGGAWWAAIYGVTQSQTWLKKLSSSSSNVSSSQLLWKHAFWNNWGHINYSIL